MIDAVPTLAPVVGVTVAGAALAVPRSTSYRAQQPAALPQVSRPRRTHPRTLRPEEQTAVRAQLNQERFVDQAPRTIYATLLDAGTVLGHGRTMYRLLAADPATRERRAIRRHPIYARPELFATAPR